MLSALLSLFVGVLPFLNLLSIVFSSILMYKMRSSIKEGEVDDSPLAGSLLLQVILCIVFAPVLAQILFYYGWKKRLPNKAKRANDIGWIAILIYIGFIWFVSWYAKHIGDGYEYGPSVQGIMYHVYEHIAEKVIK